MSGPRRVVVVPSTLALLPEHTGIDDPIPALRRAAAAAVRWLVADDPGTVEVLAARQRPDNVARGVDEPAGWRVGRALLGSAEVRTVAPGDVPTSESLLVVANGTATRSEKAPGHLDERAFAFDDEIGRALREADAGALTRLDADLAEQLWCFDVPAFAGLGRAVAGGDGIEAVVDLDEDPYGVQYWVVRWTCGS